MHCIGRVYSNVEGQGDNGNKKDDAMLTKLNIALSAALLLGTASAALAASKHPIRHLDRDVQRNVVVPGGFAYPGYSAYGSANLNAARDAYDYQRSAARGETYLYIQDKDFRDSNGGP